MREFEQLPQRLRDISTEMGISSYSGLLEEMQHNLQSMTAERRLTVDYYLPAGGTSALRQWSKLWQAGAQPAQVWQLQPVSLQQPASRVFGKLSSPVALVLVDEDWQDDLPGLQRHLAAKSSQYRLAILVVFEGAENLARSIERSFSYHSKKVVLKAEELKAENADSLEAVLQKANAAANEESLRKLAYLHSVEPMGEMLNEIFGNEQKSLAARKLLLTQNTNLLRKDEQSMNFSDLGNNIRNLVQKELGELEKNFKLKYEDLNKPNTGQFSADLGQFVQAVQDFEKTQLAEKSEKVQTTLSEDVQDNLLKRTGHQLRTEFAKDLAFAGETINNLLRNVNQQLSAKGMASISLNDLMLSQPDVERPVRSYSYISRPYQGEIIKQGMMEYFVALRDYTGLIMVVGGLLAPISMIAGSADSPIFKGMNQGLRILMGVIALGMIAYGIYDLRTRIPKKRAEEFTRELGKARESLAQEGKRIYGESSRDWMQGMQTYLKDFATALSQAVERSMKQYQQQRQNEVNNDRNVQQKQQASLELVSRGMQQAERMKDQLGQQLRTLQGDLEKQLKF